MCGSSAPPAPPAPIPERPPSLDPLKEGEAGAVGSTARKAGGTTAAGLLSDQATTSQKTLLGQ